MNRPILLLVSSLIIPVLTGCAHLSVVEEVEERSLGVEKRLSAPKAELTYTVSCERSPERVSVLECGILVEDRCDRLQVETIERATVHKKSIPLWASILEWSSAAVALGIGTAVTVDRTSPV